LEKGEGFHHNFLANLFQLTRTFLWFATSSTGLYLAWVQAIEAFANDFMLSIIWLTPDLPKRKIGLETELDIILKNLLIIRSSRMRED